MYYIKIITLRKTDSKIFQVQCKHRLCEKSHDAEGCMREDAHSAGDGTTSPYCGHLCVLLTLAIKTVTGNDSIVLGPGVKSGLDLRIDNPASLGSDIVAMCVAVKELYSCPAIIIGLGTATTILYLNEKKCYCGGAICPGIRISLDALTNNGALLPSIELQPPKKAINTNTEDCIRSGVILGTASMLDGMIDRYNEEAGVNSTVVATGGLASSVIGNCKHVIIVNDDLVLDGLRIIYAKNKK